MPPACSECDCYHDGACDPQKVIEYLKRQLAAMTGERNRAVEELDGIHARAAQVRRGLREIFSHGNTEAAA